MRRIALFALLVVLSTVALPAVASPPPQYVCGVCGQPFENAADHQDLELDVEQSELAVRIDGDGIGHWTARVTVDATTAERFRDDPDLLDSLVQETLASHWTAAENPRDVTVGMDGRTIVVTFAVPEMAHRGVDDVLLVDYFHGMGNERHYVLDADRFEIRGPEGTVLANGPPDATRENGVAVWTANGRYSSFDDETYVAFGPDRGVRTLAAAQASIAADVTPLLVEHLAVAAFLPTLVLGVGLAGVRGLLPIGRWARSRERTGQAVAALAVGWLGLLALHGRVFYGLRAVGWLLSVLFAVLGAAVASGAVQLTSRRALAFAVAAPALGAIVGASTTDYQSVLVGFGLALPVALFLPLGDTLRRGRPVGLLSVGILASPVLVAAPMVPIGGFGPVFASLLLSLWALVTVLAGAVVFHFGWALGGDGVGSDESSGRDGGI